MTIYAQHAYAHKSHTKQHMHCIVTTASSI